MPNRIDYSFLSAREGGAKLNGYVPVPAYSKSGVTIATGFNLGQCGFQNLYPSRRRLEADLLARLTDETVMETVR